MHVFFFFCIKRNKIRFEKKLKNKYDELKEEKQKSKAGNANQYDMRKYKSWILTIMKKLSIRLLPVKRSVGYIHSQNRKKTLATFNFEKCQMYYIESFFSDPEKKNKPIKLWICIFLSIELLKAI